MNRTAVGIIALVLLLTSLGLFIFPVGDQASVWMAACLRVGGLMAVVWLAHPQLSYAPRWLLFIVVLGVSVLMVIKQPRALIFLAAIFIVLARLRPTPPAPARGRATAPPRPSKL